MKGYLTTADLFKEIGKSRGTLENSELVKEELFGKIFGEEGSKLDADTKEQLISSIKEMRAKIDLEFYGLADHIKEEVTSAEQEAKPEEAEPKEEKAEETPK